MLLSRTTIINNIESKRKANLAAHGLAKNAIRNPVFQTWLEESPSCIFDVVILEQLALFL